MSERIVGLGLSIGAVMLVGGLTLFGLSRSAGQSDSVFAVSDMFQSVVPSVGFIAVGAVVAIRRRENPVGWLCFGFGLTGILLWSVEQYAAYGLLTHPGSLPGGRVGAIAVNGSFAPLIVLVLFVLLLFPDGRFLSARWRLACWGAVIGYGLLFLVNMVGPLNAPFAAIHNPLRLHRSPLTGLALVVAVPLAVGSVVAAFSAVAVRFRRARGAERAQMKWLVYVASLLPVVILAHTIADSVAPQQDGTIQGLGAIVLVALPVAIGIAILRYRLYEIDKLISRTITYALLTATLGGVFVGGVVLLTDVLPFSSPVAVAASTLAAAALFTPLRTRLQRLIDRRFNRAHYDAEVVLAAFTMSLRNEVELDAIREQLIATTKTAVAPTHASIWIRPST